MKAAPIHSNVTLSDLRNGAAEELFQAALGQVLKNIDDVNTSEKAKRSITIKFAFTPKGDRAATDLDISVDVKLAGNKPVQTYMTLKQDGAEFIGFEPSQESLPYNPAN